MSLILYRWTSNLKVYFIKAVSAKVSDVIGLVRLLVGPVGKSRKSQPVMSIDWLATG